mgnify:CR=1 FL=1
MKPPHKVLHLITELNTGGAQKALVRLLARLDRQRFSPAVVCLYNGDGAVSHEIRDLGVPVTDLGMTAKWRWDAFWRLYRLLRRERPVILHTWMFHANLPGRLLGQVVGIPVVITSRRNVNIGGSIREWLTRWTAGLDDKVIAVCEQARQAEIERAQIPPQKVVTIHNGCDVKGFSQVPAEASAQIREALAIPPDVSLIGSIGRLHPQKDFAALLTAVPKIQEQNPDIHLLLVGEGELRDDLEAQSQLTGLARLVTFAGYRTEIPEILGALDVFVLPSLWEGMPNVVLEAMAAGLSVVATAVGGTPEVVVDGITGLLVPPYDSDALAEAINRLLCDPDLRHRMGQAGRTRIEHHFSIEETVQRTEELYMKLLKKKGY